jgi:hypothetical protein
MGSYLTELMCYSKCWRVRQLSLNFLSQSVVESDFNMFLFQLQNKNMLNPILSHIGT